MCVAGVRYDAELVSVRGVGAGVVGPVRFQVVPHGDPALHLHVHLRQDEGAQHCQRAPHRVGSPPTPLPAFAVDEPLYEPLYGHQDTPPCYCKLSTHTGHEKNFSAASCRLATTLDAQLTEDPRENH
jgi:hypothetical protein